MPPLLLTLAVALLLAAPASAAPLTPSVVGEPPTGNGVFRFPQALTYSPGAQHVFVGDQYSSVVQEFTRDGAWERDIAFRADAGQLGRIGTVGGLAADRNGHLFVLDSENDRVQVFSMSTGGWLASFGSHGSGPGQFDLGHNTGAGGIAIGQPDPQTPAIAYIADQYNHRIQRFTLAQDTPAGERVLPPGARPSNPAVVPVPTPDTMWGQFGDCAVGGCTPTGMNYPQGVAVDPDANRVFVADDDNHRVVEYDLNGVYIAQIGGFGTGPGQFRFPYDVAVDSRQPHQLYVADNNNHRVQAFDAASLAFLRTWGSFGPQIGGMEYIRALGAVADDPGGGVGVADTAGNRVQVFDPAGQVLAAWGIAGRGPGYVTAPFGVALGPGGALAVADTRDARVALFDPDGTYGGQIGLVSANSLFTFAGPADGQLDTPSGVAFDAAGDVWIADTANDRVVEVAPDGRWLGATTGFAGPLAVAVGPDGAVYVADTGNDRVRRRNPTTGAWSDVSVGASLQAPGAVAVDPTGTLYIADASRVLALPAGGPAAMTISPPSGTTWDHPGGLAADATTLYVANDAPGNGAVLSRSGGAWQTLATDGHGPGDVVDPGGLALAPSGTLYVADTGNNRVLRFDPPGVSAPQQQPLTVTVDALTHGVVTSVPAGITCPTDCVQHFGDGRQVVLTATPAAGWQLAGWGGACSGAGACSLTMNSAGAVSASFAAAPPPPQPPPPPPPPPASAGAPAPPPRDTVPPRLAALRLVPRVLHPGGRVRLAFVTPEPVTVVLRVQARRRGRQVGSSCVAPSRANRLRPRCTRWVALPGHRTLHLRAGAAALTLTRRPAGRLLRAGRYRLVLAATDAAGNHAHPRTITFAVAARS